MPEQKNIKIYLAHSSTHTDREKGKMVQEKLEAEGYLVINPFDDRDGAYSNMVSRDITDIIKSDILICLYPQHLITVGVDQELVYAHLFRTFVVAFVPEKIIQNAWLRYHSDLMFTSDREKDILEILETVKITMEEQKCD